MRRQGFSCELVSEDVRTETYSLIGLRVLVLIENAVAAFFVCGSMCGKSTQFRRNHHVFAVVGTNSPVNVECANMSHDQNKLAGIDFGAVLVTVAAIRSHFD